jgi:hypothetical protein
MKTTIEINGTDFNFDVPYREFNKFLDGQVTGRVTQASFNLLTKTVSKTQAKALMAEIAVDGEPRGMVVIEAANKISEAFEESDGSVVKKR